MIAKLGIDFFSFILGTLCGYLLFAIVALIIAEIIDHNK